MIYFAPNHSTNMPADSASIPAIRLCVCALSHL